MVFHSLVTLPDHRLERVELQRICRHLGFAARVSNDVLKGTLLSWHHEQQTDKGGQGRKHRGPLWQAGDKSDGSGSDDSGAEDVSVSAIKSQEIKRAASSSSSSTSAEGITSKRARKDSPEETTTSLSVSTPLPAAAAALWVCPSRITALLKAECQAIMGGVLRPLPRPVSAASLVARFIVAERATSTEPVLAKMCDQLLVRKLDAHFVCAPHSKCDLSLSMKHRFSSRESWRLCFCTPLKKSSSKITSNLRGRGPLFGTCTAQITSSGLSASCRCVHCSAK